MRVVVLYNLFERLERGEARDIVAEKAIVEEIGAVEEALRSLGHQSYVIAIQDEILPVIHWLKEIQPDMVFNLCESIYGNSCLEMNIPALLDLFKIPYTGSGPLTLGLCQDKGKVKDILRSHGIPTPRFQVYENGGQSLLWIDRFPVIVKPLHEDGSLGISKESVVFDSQALVRQVRYVTERYMQPALIEEFIDGRELNVGLIEREGGIEVLPVSEIDYSEFPEDLPKICSYAAKWELESAEYQKSKPICPAVLEPGLKSRIEETSLKVYKLFGCRDYARVDMRLDGEEEAFVLEVNPNPDISPQSGMVRALQARGITYPEFVQNLIDRAMRRRSKRECHPS